MRSRTLDTGGGCEIRTHGRLPVGSFQDCWFKPDRKSTRLNSSHSQISYAVFCLKKKKKNRHADMHGRLEDPTYSVCSRCAQTIIAFLQTPKTLPKTAKASA